MLKKQRKESKALLVVNGYVRIFSDEGDDVNNRDDIDDSCYWLGSQRLFLISPYAFFKKKF